MIDELTFLAPAKINLYLEVLGKRSDGYHGIISIFQAVTLSDRITIRSLKQDNIFKLKGNYNIPLSEDIITKTVSVFRKETCNYRGIHIHIEKDIPIGAGLAGGSSDGAAVLQGLNNILKTGLSGDRLHMLARNLGSDVPFFLSNGSAALVWGRGEKVKPLTPRSDFDLILIYPGFSVNTKEAYSWIDDMDDMGYIERFPRLSKEEVECSYSNSSVCKWELFNSFQKPLEHHFPQIKKITNELKQCGALCSGISGTGSSVFGLFIKEEVAGKAFRCLCSSYPFVRRVKPLQKRHIPD